MDRLVTLNRWIQAYDLELAKAKAYGLDTPTWYTHKYNEWVRERDVLVWGA